MALPPSADLLPSPSAPTTSAYRWYVVGVLHLATLTLAINVRLFTLVIESVRAHFGVGDTAIGLLMGAGFALFAALSGLVLGRLADRTPRRAILIGSTLLFSCFGVFSGVASTFALLFLCRIGVGAGRGGLLPATYSLLSDYFPPHQRGLAISIVKVGNRLGGGLALLLGSLLLGYFAEQTNGWSIFSILAPWQATLVIAGLPGLLLALLLAFTIREPSRMDDTATGVVEAPQSAYDWPIIRSYLQYNRATMVFLSLAVGLFFLGTIGTGVWVPSFLIRTYGWTAAQAGQGFGWVLLLGSTLGTLTGGRLALFLAKRGHEDANVRVLLFALVGLVPCRTLFPLMPTGELALAVLAPTLFLASMPLGTLAAAIQNIFPNRMRGFASALYVLLVNLAGMGLGPACIALTTDYIFGDAQALRYALLLIGLITTIGSLFFTLRCLPAYRQSRTYALTWKP